MNHPAKSKIARVAKVYRASEQPKDRKYWLTKTPEERVAALEEIRNEHHAGDDESVRRLQRVYRIVKQQ
jgi:hypothetical protein